MYQHLVEKARLRRQRALLDLRMPLLNIFWDGRRPAEHPHTVIANLTDLRIRMGRHRAPLAPPRF